MTSLSALDGAKMIPIDYVCFMNQTGYAQAALANVLALDASDRYDVRLNCVHTIGKESFSDSLHRKLQALAHKEQNPNAVQIFHLIPDMQRRVADNRLRKNIGYATFETFKPPVRWASTLNQNDAVICPSEFNCKIFANRGVNRPIVRIPHCLDLSIWNENVSPLYKNSEFTFLFVGTWRKRKGWDLLIRAWAEAFDKDSNVKLVIKTDKTDKAERKVESELSSIGKESAPIYFEKKILSESLMPSFYKSADCLISPTLGEGFGLPPLQSMAVNVPVIVTNFSGCTEYASNDTCTLIEPDGFLFHDMMDDIPQFAAQKWPRLRVEDIAKAMRSVVDDYDTAKAKSERGCSLVQNSFGYNQIVSYFDKMMEQVYGVSNP
tara:strand:+ start:32221 stop:33354 length:1134 start_codon:yes stop_codon:yes gene_type:complete